jgi:thymidylate kinase
MTLQSGRPSQASAGTEGQELTLSLDMEKGVAQRALTPDISDTAKFLRALFLLLDEHAVRYCVLHSWESLGFEILSDLDLAIHPADRSKLPAVFRRLQDSGYLLMQSLNYSVNSYYFVFCWFEGPSLRCLPLDCIFEHWRSGLSVLSVEEVIAHRERSGDTWIPSRPHQFAYLLAKRTWKGKSSAAQTQQLKELVESIGRSQAESIAGEMFLGKWNQRLVAAYLTDSLPSVLESARHQPWITAVIRHPLRFGRYAWDQARRLVRRWLRPTGLLIAVLGPDGSGKDTVIDGMTQEVERGFRRTAVYHWRPNIILPRKPAPPVTDPHANPPRGALLSSFFLIGFVLDYWIGYALRIRPYLTRGTLVIFDRYFYDVIVDPKRARFGGPAWLPKLLARLVPAPDLTLLLDADEQLMFARKGELSVTELQRQRHAYRALQVGIAARTIVRTDQEIEKTIAEASGAVVQFMHQRLESRNEEWLRQPAAANARG